MTIRRWMMALCGAGLLVAAPVYANGLGSAFGSLMGALSGHKSSASPSTTSDGNTNGGMALVGRLLHSADDAFGKVTPAQREKIGEQAAAVLLGASRPVRNARLQRYVNRVGRWVALHTDAPNLDWRFVVLDTKTLNAFSAPGGFVFITKGLLDNLHSEAELAGVLAHECVHVVRHHYLVELRKSARMDLAATLVDSATRGQEHETLEKVTSGFREIYSRGMSKDEEYQADYEGTVLAARAGYDPYGLLAVLQRLAARRPGGTSLSFMFNTHPLLASRIKRLESAFGPLDRYGNQPDLTARFRYYVARR